MNALSIGSIVLLGLACLGMAWWIIRDERNERRREHAERWAHQQAKASVPTSRPKHDGRTVGAETVPDLLRRIRQADEALGWADDEDAPALVRAYIAQDYPTVVLPRVPPEPPTVPLPVLVPEQPHRKSRRVGSEPPGLVAYYAPRLTSDY